jgi:hypothetical protein
MFKAPVTCNPVKIGESVLVNPDTSDWDIKRALLSDENDRAIGVAADTDGFAITLLAARFAMFVNVTTLFAMLVVMTVDDLDPMISPANETFVNTFSLKTSIGVNDSVLVASSTKTEFVFCRGN